MNPLSEVEGSGAVWQEMHIGKHVTMMIGVLRLITHGINHIGLQEFEDHRVQGLLDSRPHPLRQNPPLNVRERTPLLRRELGVVPDPELFVAGRIGEKASLLRSSEGQFGFGGARRDETATVVLRQRFEVLLCSREIHFVRHDEVGLTLCSRLVYNCLDMGAFLSMQCIR